MNLAEKLRLFVGNNETSKKGIANKQKLASQVDKKKLCEIFNGKAIETPHGQHILVEKNYNTLLPHGGVKLKEIFNIKPEILSLINKNEEFKKVDFRKTVFIDTETTGLAGGSGTYIFLFGAGYFQGENFILRQYFMDDYDKEPATLYSINSFLQQFDSVVSFNGKAYDIPLLTTRLLMNRFESPLKGQLHMDLLAPARRLYRQRLASVSLASLEKNLCSIKRKGDIPGYEIPALYFRFLNNKNPYPLKPVFYHNRIDILTLITLTCKMAKALEDPFYSDSCEEEDYYCLGKVYEDMGLIQESINCYTKALSIRGVKEKAYLQLSLLYKRLGKWKEAVDLWDYMQSHNIYSIFALIELAKYYEHKVKDYEMAQMATQKALELTYRKQNLLGNCPETEIEDIKKRLNRIQLKRAK